MKKTIFTTLALLFFLFSYSQKPDIPDESEATKSLNVEVYDDNAVSEYWRKVWARTPKHGGYLSAHMGFTPNHPNAFMGYLGSSAGAVFRLFELSGHYLSSIGSVDYKTDVIAFTGGMRFPIVKMFTLTTRAGYYTVWNGQDRIQWSGGNRIIYGAEASMRIHDRVELGVTGWKIRSRRSKSSLHIASYESVEVWTLSLKYILKRKKK